MPFLPRKREAGGESEIPAQAVSGLCARRVCFCPVGFGRERPSPVPLGPWTSQRLESECAEHPASPQDRRLQGWPSPLPAEGGPGPSCWALTPGGPEVTPTLPSGRGGLTLVRTQSWSEHLKPLLFSAAPPPRYRCLLLVDSVASLGGAPIYMDQQGKDTPTPVRLWALRVRGLPARPPSCAGASSPAAAHEVRARPHKAWGQDRAHEPTPGFLLRCQVGT